MNYNQLLRKIIDESGVSLEEISRRCKAMSVPVSAKYLSILRKEESRKVSEKKAQAIAKACGKHEDVLIIQAYYDKAPKTFKVILADIRNISTLSVLRGFKDVLSKPMMRALKKRYYDMSMAEFYTSIGNPKRVFDPKAIAGLVTSVNETNDESKGNALAEAFKSAISSRVINVDDYIVFESNSMAPTIPAGSRIITVPINDLSECQNNDVLCYTNVKKDCMQIRRVKFPDNMRPKFLMIPDNKDVDEFETLEAHDIKLIGKVVQIIVDIK